MQDGIFFFYMFFFTVNTTMHPQTHILINMVLKIEWNWIKLNHLEGPHFSRFSTGSDSEWGLQYIQSLWRVAQVC